MRGLVIGVIVGFALSSVLGLGRGWVIVRGAASDFQEPPRTMLPGGQVREFRLVARPGKWEVAPGTVLDAWTYNGQVPGPELRVREGDLMRVTVKNALPVPTTIHWHGVDLDWRMDGPPGVNQDPILPGQTFVYEFVAYPAGTRIYHSHVDPNVQMELGLYGALIIEPREPEPVKYDREYTYLLDELALDFTTKVALGKDRLPMTEFGNGRGGALQYDLFLMNGKAGSAIPPLRLKAGERVRIRLINVGSLPHAMHIHGHIFKIVATDGNPVPAVAQWRKDTVLIGPGERYDLDLAGYNPGVWMFHCHMPNHGENGMMTTINYDGFKPHREHGHLPPVQPQAAARPGAAPAPAVPAQPAAVRVADLRGTTSSPGAIVAMLDNRFQPANVTVPVGATVMWANRGINGHTTTGIDTYWDSPTMATRQRFGITFTRPGTYRYVCRQHLLSGMVGTIEVGQGR
jgi:FtsP/CotA-like multicopper oxidase with cupredoxin domain